MDTTCTSFSYPILTYNGNLLLGDGRVSATNHMKKLSADVLKNFKCQVLVVPPPPSKTDSFTNAISNEIGFVEMVFAVTLWGPLNQVLGAKGFLLRNNPNQSTFKLHVCRRTLLNDNNELKPSVKKRLDDIMESTKTQITILGQQQQSKAKAPPGFGGSAHGSVDVEIMGTWDCAEKARIACLVAIDEMCGLSVEVVNIDAKLCQIMCGRKRDQLNKVIHETSTNIYLPSPFLSSFKNAPKEQGSTNDDASAGETVGIYISGSKACIEKAKEALLSLAAEKV